MPRVSRNITPLLALGTTTLETVRDLSPPPGSPSARLARSSAGAGGAAEAAAPSSDYTEAEETFLSAIERGPDWWREERGENEAISKTIEHPRHPERTRDVSTVVVNRREEEEVVVAGKAQRVTDLEYHMTRSEDLERKANLQLDTAQADLVNESKKRNVYFENRWVENMPWAKIRDKILFDVINSGEDGLFPVMREDADVAGSEGVIVRALAHGRHLHHRACKTRPEDRASASKTQMTINGQELNFTLRGVYDGHGGDNVAEALKRYLPMYLQKRLELHISDELTTVDVVNAARLALVDFSRQCENNNARHAGSCANFSLEFTDPNTNIKHLIVSNVADSRCIFLNVSEGRVATIALSSDQKLPPEEEYNPLIYDKYDALKRYFSSRIGQDEGAGAGAGAAGAAALAMLENTPNIMQLGSVYRRNTATYSCLDGRVGALNIPRSIGEGVVSARGKVTHVTKTNLEERLDASLDEGKSYIMHISDGILDVMTTNEIADLFNRFLNEGMSFKDAAKCVVQAAKHNLLNSHDDCTIIIHEITL